MKRLGISVECRHVPPLDPDFMPLLRFNRAFLAGAKQPVSLAVERADGQMAVCHTFLHGTPDMAAATGRSAPSWTGRRSSPRRWSGAPS